jgi:hypothetical protein
MKSPWSDWMVLLTLALTLLLVFGLVFSQRPRTGTEPPLLWRQPADQERSGSLQI